MIVLEMLEYRLLVHLHFIGDLLPNFRAVPRGQSNVVIDEFLVVFERYVFLGLEDLQNSLFQFLV